MLKPYSSAHHHPKVRRTALLRILLDARPVGDGRHGIARYILSMAPHLAAEEGIEWTVACAPAWEQYFRALGMRTLRASVVFTSPLAPVSLARMQREVRPDLTFCPSFVPAWPSRGPQVLTLHDATHLLRPRDFSPLVGLYYRGVTLRAARRAPATITVSEYSKRQLERVGGLRNVTVVYPGVAHDLFRPQGPRDERIPERSILYVGGFKPHKRVELLVDALATVPGATLVLVGSVPDALLARALAAGVRDRVLLLGSLTDEALAAAYRSATVFAFPSALEGFGSPPVEAMASGLPVVVTNGSSLAEVVAEAGVRFDEGAKELEGALTTLLDDVHECERLRAAGLRRAAEFSYERSACKTAEVLRGASGSDGEDQERTFEGGRRS